MSDSGILVAEFQGLGKVYSETCPRNHVVFKILNTRSDHLPTTTTVLEHQHGVKLERCNVTVHVYVTHRHRHMQSVIKKPRFAKRRFRVECPTYRQGSVGHSLTLPDLPRPEVHAVEHVGLNPGVRVPRGTITLL